VWPKVVDVPSNLINIHSITQRIRSLSVGGIGLPSAGAMS
jgi:hypothetical protein